MAAMRVVSAVLACGTCAASYALSESLPLRLHVTEGTQTVWLSVDDIKGSYTLPYIQSAADLTLEFSFDVDNVASAQVALIKDGAVLSEQETKLPAFRAEFPGLRPGEYAVRVRGFDADGGAVCQSTWERVAIGTVVVALGDSITEGYFSRGYMQEDLALRADGFPTEAVSRDGRNFPQFAPTTHHHLPTVNCFESWMTPLNESLAETWKHPVFIANEGWGGISSAGYLDMIRKDAGWRSRMRQLRPSVWLIHLGVNDERAHVPTAEFAANMGNIVDLLIKEFGAKPEGIFIAKPSYDYFEGAPEILAEYCEAIDRLVSERGLRTGPDLFALYSTARERWYGADPVHPNVAGMRRMAEAWHDALVAALPSGPKR
jgi:lysophospholipase L1-like esterase